MPRYDVPKYAPDNDYSEPEYALSHPKTIILINRLVNLVKLTELLNRATEVLITAAIGFGLMIISSRTFEIGAGMTSVSVFWTLVNMYRCYKLKKKL